jgi:hypothetical protein
MKLIADWGVKSSRLDRSLARGQLLASRRPARPPGPARRPRWADNYSACGVSRRTSPAGLSSRKPTKTV